MHQKDLEEKFLEVIEENKRTIYKVCLMYSEGKDQQEDLYQDIILNLWKAFPTFRQESKYSTWIYRISINTSISQIRKKKARPLTTPITCEFDKLIGDDGSYRKQVLELYKLISQLSEFERAVILLWLDEKSYDEIADILGISKSNVGVRITRIKEKLTKMNSNN
ncbi:MAG: sigma-70 family RNA polymerase sigma factor [Bacteroidales bacterium]|nr:sigma-70 family RNA polymerase sigma factor [Bacteroidales bacterium]